MLRPSLVGSFVALTLAILSPTAHAGIVWDWSPDATGGSGQPNWSNNDSFQNFAETISFGANTTLTAMDIYGGNQFGSAGQSANIRIWSDNTGAPDAVLHQFTETISIVDTNGTTTLSGITRKHVAFTLPVTLSAATTYWIGMAGNGFDLVQLGLQNHSPGDGKMYQMVGPTPTFFANIGDMSFRLEGSVVPAASAVPEPSTLISAATAGVVGLAMLRRRRRAVR